MTAGSISITNVAVFDGESDELVDGPVRIVDGRIAEIGESVGADDPVVDGEGGVAIPGLIDAHFHAYGIALDLHTIGASASSYVALAGARRLRSALSRGFTTVRDPAGGDPGLARAIAEGLIAAPRYLYTGPALSQTGGHGDERAPEVDLCGHPHLGEVVDGVDAVRRAVRDRFRRGAHAIKIMASGGVVSPTDPIRRPQYSAEEIAAIVDEATRRESYVAAHAYSPEAIRHCVEQGVRSVEHGNLLDGETAKLMAERGAFLVPTLATYDAMSRRGAQVGMSTVARAKNEEVLSAGREAVTIARAAGVPIGFGTDLMGELEDEQLSGLRLQCEVEGPLRALQSATSVNAALLQSSDLGRLRVGAVGDVVLLRGNPLTDPELLWDRRRPATVIAAGRVVAAG
jgi:imidazolonepropionase-like amidohydrolase